MSEPVTIMRAVEFLVAHVHEGGSWQEFLACLHTLWRQSTDCANWCIRDLVRCDVSRSPEQQQLPPFPTSVGESRYRRAVALFGALPTKSVSCLVRSAERHYFRQRLALWQGNVAVPLYRYPAPFPMHPQHWRPTWATGSSGERPGIAFGTGQPVKRKNGHDWTLTLRTGPAFGRQLALFRQIVSGEATPCEMALYRKRANGGHANGTPEKVPGGGNRVRYDVVAKLVARFPRRHTPKESGWLWVRTHPELFWEASLEGRLVNPWRLNACEVARWLAQSRHWVERHDDFRQGLADDLKLERRVHVGSRVQMQGALDARCDKQRRRLDTWMHQVVAQVVGFAVRQGCCGIVYDDTERGWCHRFPWCALRTRLASKCEEFALETGGVLGQGETTEEEAEEVASV